MADITKIEFPDRYLDKLEAVIRFESNKNRLLRCPQCGRFYFYEYEYKFLIPESEEHEYLTRIKPNKVMKAIDSIIDYLDFKEMVVCGHILKLNY